MTLSHLGSDAARVALVFAFALLWLRFWANASASARRFVLVTAFAASFAIPVSSQFAPSWPIETPQVIGAIVARPVIERPLENNVESSRSSLLSRGVGIAPQSAWRPSWPRLISLAWALGAGVLALRAVLGHLRVRRLARRARPVDASWGTVLEEIDGNRGARTRLVMTDEVNVPAVIGFFSAVVLLPRDARAWSDERRRVVLMHELSHVRHRDALAQLLAQLACSLHWYNPLVWIAARRLQFERELAADDAVIAAVRPSSYAEHLLAIAGVHRTSSASFGAALGMTEAERLVERVVAIVDERRQRAPMSRSGAAAVLGGAVALVLTMSCLRSATPAGGAAPPASTGAASIAQSVKGASPSSTLDPRLQSIADDEIDRAARELSPDAAGIVVLDPNNGRVLANAGRASGSAADVGVGRAFVPASTLKTITLAAALEEGVVSLNEKIDCQGGRRRYPLGELRDAQPHGMLGLGEALAVSSNVAFTRVSDALGGETFVLWMRRFHFGEAPRLSGVQAASGMVPDKVDVSTYEGAMVALGDAMMASPLQVAAAYAAFANGGLYYAPTLTPKKSEGERVIRAETAGKILSMLEGVVNHPRGTGKRARIDGVRVAGKTGTGEYSATPGGATHVYGTFVGIVPADRPRFVIVVGIDSLLNDETNDELTGANVAAPLFARVATRAVAP